MIQFNVRAAVGPADVPAGTYTGTLVSVDSEQITSAFGQKQMWRWTFMLDVNGQPKELSALTGQTLDPTRSTAYKFLSALLKRAPAIGESLSPPIGTRALVAVVIKPNGYPKIDHLEPFSEPESIIPGVPR